MKPVCFIFVVLLTKALSQAPEGLKEGQAYQGSDNGDEPLIRCKRPMCKMFCSLGFKTDSMGCPICECLHDPCARSSCQPHEQCIPQKCASKQSCTELPHQCIPLFDRCPMPMCANKCEIGYRHNEAGCMTCDCVEPDMKTSRKCADKECDEGQVCKTVKTTNPVGKEIKESFCTAEPLCTNAFRMASMARDPSSIVHSPLPECTTEGRFKPRQCNYLTNECWCADDLGREIDGTRVLIPVNDEVEAALKRPACKPNITIAINIRMIFLYDGESESINPHIGNLEHVLSGHVGSWLLMREEFITVNEVKEADRSLVVKLVILHDGVTDLPSALHHMKRKMQRGECKIQLDHHTLSPVADKLTSQHKFFIPGDREDVAPPVYVEHHGIYDYCVHHKVVISSAIVGFMIFSTVFVIILIMLHARKRRHSQTGHIRDSQKILLADEDFNKDPVFISDEKQPIV